MTTDLRCPACDSRIVLERLHRGGAYRMVDAADGDAHAPVCLRLEPRSEGNSTRYRRAA